MTQALAGQIPGGGLANRIKQRFSGQNTGEPLMDTPKYRIDQKSQSATTPQN
jgi:hypothetical protein